MAEPVLTVDHLGKAYRLGDVRQSSTTFLGTVRSAVKTLFRPPPNQSALFWALRDVSLSVAQGEFVGVIGRKGAGKSTLLKVISRITEPTNGRVRLRGRVAAMLDANTDFHPELTARESVFLRGANLGMTWREIRSRFDELVDFSGVVGKFLDTPMKYYSLGMTAQLSFAVAAHLDSELLLVDEAFSFVGVEFLENWVTKMRQVAGAEERAVLFVSQDMAAIRQLCPRAILMHQGRVIVDGPTEEAIREYQASSGTSADKAQTDTLPKATNWSPQTDD